MKTKTPTYTQYKLPSDDMKIERVERMVIERKLLAALTDAAVVAVHFTKQDLELLIAALLDYELVDSERKNMLVEGLKQLKDSAF